MAHFWSLSVEEQFYLIWPVVVLLCPRRHVIAAIVAAIIVAPAYRSVAVASGWNHVVTQWQLPSCLDTLGSGALLAMLARKLNPRAMQRLLRALFIAGLPFVVFCYSRARESAVLTVWGDTACALLFGSLVAQSAISGLGTLMPLITNRAAVSIGQISYGIYLYHLPVRHLWRAHVAPWLGVTTSAGGDSVGSALAFSAVTVAVAALSWHLLEAPILSLKSRWTPTARPAEITARPKAIT